jgi:hypothetical protein
VSILIERTSHELSVRTGNDGPLTRVTFRDSRYGLARVRELTITSDRLGHTPPVGVLRLGQDPAARG